MDLTQVGLAVTTVLVVAIVSWIDTMTRSRRVERKLDALLRHHGVDPAQRPPLSERVQQLAADPARKVEAIRAYREETGAGLAEAKEAVEAYARTR